MKAPRRHGAGDSGQLVNGIVADADACYDRFDNPHSRKPLAARQASRSRSVTRNQWRSLSRVADLELWEDSL